MKKYNVGYIQNSSGVFHILADNQEQAKQIFCNYINVSYPNNYIKIYRSDLGKSILGELDKTNWH